MGEPSFLIPLSVAGIAYLLAVREFFSTLNFPRRVVVIGLVFAAAWHVPFLLARPGFDDERLAEPLCKPLTHQAC